MCFLLNPSGNSNACEQQVYYVIISNCQYCGNPCVMSTGFVIDAGAHVEAHVPPLHLLHCGRTAPKCISLSLSQIHLLPAAGNMDVFPWEYKGAERESRLFCLRSLLRVFVWPLEFYLTPLLCLKIWTLQFLYSTFSAVLHCLVFPYQKAIS